MLLKVLQLCTLSASLIIFIYTAEDNEHDSGGIPMYPVYLELAVLVSEYSVTQH